MLDTRMRGFAVMNPDMTGIYLESEDFETCKRYCLNGNVIVRAEPVRCGFAFRVWYHRKNKWFEWSRYYKVLLKCRLFFDYEYCHRYGKEILYTNPYGYSESIERGIIDR